MILTYQRVTAKCIRNTKCGCIIPLFGIRVHRIFLCACSSIPEIPCPCPIAWTWDFGDGATSTQKDPVHTYTKEGNYTTTLRVANAFGSDSLIRKDHILVGNPLPGLTPEPEVINFSPSGTSQPEGIVGLIRVAKGTTEKHLPASGFIPPQFMALAAVLTSFSVVLINLLISNIS